MEIGSDIATLWTVLRIETTPCCNLLLAHSVRQQYLEQASMDAGPVCLEVLVRRPSQDALTFGLDLFCSRIIAQHFDLLSGASLGEPSYDTWWGPFTPLLLRLSLPFDPSVGLFHPFSLLLPYGPLSFIPCPPFPICLSVTIILRNFQSLWLK